MRLTLIGLKKCVDMKKYILILLIAISVFPLKAQNDELNKLTDIVRSLQTGGEKAYKDAIATLSADKLWTLMDELGIDRNVECRASERVPGFRLNSALTNAESKERYQTSTGNHLNGADIRYNYSLFEKTLKGGMTASFSLPQRWGEQVIIIIPFNVHSKISAKASGGDKAFTISPSGNGSLKLTGVIIKGQDLNLSVTNESEEKISYVILNYNSRK